MKLIEQIIELTFTDAAVLPPESLSLAKLSLFDWVICGLGGCNEPVSQKVRSYITGNHATGNCSVFGGDKFSTLAAALANGTTSHALDYDDTHFAHIGHLSVGVFPAAFAVAQETDDTLNKALEAFLVGAEAAIKIGMTLGPEHYERGYHQTATAGAFGATVAAVRLYKLSPVQCRAALGLCATRASGLKNQFGTMGKPLNAGYAASNGVECAKLAQSGVTSADDGLQGLQGFIETHSADPVDVTDNNRFLFEDIRFKLHACCHGTHAMIEAILIALNKQQFSIEDVKTLQVCVHPKWLRVCDNKNPATGLEVKFSYLWLAGMTIKGLPTADPAVYTDELCGNTELQAFAKKVTVIAGEMPDTATKIVCCLDNGVEIATAYDLSESIETSVLSEKLRAKGNAVVGKKAEALWAQIQNGRQTARELSLS